MRKTGKLAWWHQEVPHDVWDYDACAPVIFFDALDGNGKLVPAAAEAGKVGNVFIVNRLTGKLLRKSEPFVLQTANIFTPPSDIPVTIAPGPNGGSQWSPAAYSPRTHDFYVMGVNQAWTFTAKKTEPYVPGTPLAGQIIGGTMKVIIDGTTEPGIAAPTGSLSAVNVNTGKIDWQYKSELPMVGGVLATASDLVFAGEMDGDINAFHARTGKKLWHFNLGVAVTAPPMTYRVNGVQYVAVAAGGLAVNGWQQLMAKMGRPLNGDVVAIFALPEKTNRKQEPTMKKLFAAARPFALALAPVAAVAQTAYPVFKPDLSFNKQMPHGYFLGQVAGITEDSHGNIWVIHRPRRVVPQLDEPPQGSLGHAGALGGGI